MKFLILVIYFCLFAFNVNTQTIATFKLSLILESLQSYKDFMIKIDDFKKKRFDELRKEENLLVSRLKEIEDSKILLSEIEYLSRISEFNDQKNIFEKKVNKLNNYLKKNIEKSEKKILQETVEIVKIIAIENTIDIVFFDEQYFLASDNIDISGQIYNKLNDLDIAFELSDYE